MEARLIFLGYWLVYVVLLVSCSPTSKNDAAINEPEIHSIPSYSAENPDELTTSSSDAIKDPATTWLHPELFDHFLYEDKYYLKLRFPKELPGELSIGLLEGNHYSVTPLDSTVFQLIIYDALDLKVATLELDYAPTDSDTLAATRLVIKHVTNVYDGN
ncbi:MAG: hypothetical protein JJU34_11215 [Lunatimonas sp.]|uniref:hypothetical protein n=1 Tax=Lunatimonas sp. TaxID=2060141 RepID=UPI00263AEDE6|nr:hypothetical protein [Lunatimonas sp.]MCC5937839.1 hypothetical protein [Lunatimonas sp.]